MKDFSQKLLFTLCISLLHSVPVTAASFNDVAESHPYSGAIEFLRSSGIVEGYSDGTYKPHDFINRAEFTKIVTGAQFNSDETIDSCNQVFFPDIRKADWFAKYVCVAKTKNIISGYPNGMFKPANDISFAEAAKILIRVFMGDVESDAIWYKPYVQKLAGKNAIPLSISTFDQKISRGEMAEMIWRLKAGANNKLSRTYDELGLRTADSGETGLPFSFSYPASWGELEKVGDEYGSWRLMGLRDTQFAANISITAKKPGLQFITKPCSYIGCPLDTDFDTYRASLKTNRTTDGGIRVSQRDNYSPESGSFRRRAEFFAGDYQVMFGGWADFLVYEKEYDRRVSQGLSPSISGIVLEDISWEDEHPMDIVFGLYPSETVAEQRFFMQIDAMIGSIR